MSSNSQNINSQPNTSCEILRPYYYVKISILLKLLFHLHNILSYQHAFLLQVHYVDAATILFDLVLLIQPIIVTTFPTLMFVTSVLPAVNQRRTSRIMSHVYSNLALSSQFYSQAFINSKTHLLSTSNSTCTLFAIESKRVSARR